jgi:hypothetical protein
MIPKFNSPNSGEEALPQHQQDGLHHLPRRGIKTCRKNHRKMPAILKLFPGKFYFRSDIKVQRCEGESS